MNRFDRLYATDALRELDRRACAFPGLDADILMSRAAEAAYSEARSRWPHSREWLLLCGPGNNGGDGFAMAEFALRDGLAVRVLHVPPGEERDGPALRARRRFEQAGGTVELTHDWLPEQGLQGDLIVDALLGIGLTRPPGGLMASLIEAADAHSAPRLALDVPSGVDAGTGAAPGVAIRADATVSFMAGKVGLLTGAGRDRCGLRVDDSLGLDISVFEGVKLAARRLVAADLAGMFPPRRLQVSKADFGHPLLVGGNHGMGGALLLAADAAHRTGAGRVSAWTRSEHLPAMLSRRPECMVREVIIGADGRVRTPMAGSVNAFAVGPGLGRDDWARSLLDFGMEQPLPLLLDADALNLLSADGRLDRGSPTVLTPHLGEAARLLDEPAEELADDRIATAIRIAERYNAAVVLKGPGTVVATPGELPSIVDAGNPGMASGGMGDALSGVIVALLAAGMPAFEAACAGALLHSVAADRAARQGERGLLASDVIERLRECANPAIEPENDHG